MWGGRSTAAQQQHVDRYTQWLTRQLIAVAQTALAERRTGRLEWGQGKVSFGGNRRALSEGRWVGFGFQTDGPVDHSLPVLLARDRQGNPLAIWTNYACHCTTAGARNRISGDWAGFANQAIEREFPGAIALTTIGCGADVGPQPTGSLELARRHGEALAAEVQRLLAQPLTPLSGDVSAEQLQLALPFAEPPSREQFENLATRQDFDGYHARLMLTTLDETGELPTHLDYPLSCWKFGSDLAIVFLAGEVVVDYAVRLKTELDWQRLWINGWSNDVPSYIPSRRVLAEGGYEADFSQIYYGHPTRYAPAVEDLIVNAVHDLVGPEFLPPANSDPPDFLRGPTARDAFEGRLPDWFAAIDPATREFVERVVTLSRLSQNGFDRLVSNDGGTDSWFNYSGTQASRPYIRQQRPGDTLAWLTPEIELRADTDRQVFVFVGGIGWQSEPVAAGFTLLIAEEPVLKFDVTTSPKVWHSSDESVRLSYLPTWTSDVDSGGFFYLEISNDRLKAGEPLELSVRSEGMGSKRWFSLDAVRDVKDLESVLIKQFKASQTGQQ